MSIFSNSPVGHWVQVKSESCEFPKNTWVFIKRIEGKFLIALHDSIEKRLTKDDIYNANFGD